MRRKTGGKMLAIPHNGNLSNGRMFEETTFTGGPMTKAYAEARQKWEPLMELTQIKGQSESHPSLSPDRRIRQLGPLGPRQPERRAPRSRA